MYTGVTTTKNLLGMITLITGLGAMWRFLHIRRSEDGTSKKGRFVAEGALLAMVFYLLWISNSATSLSCFLMAGTLILVTSWSWVRRMPLFVHALVLVMVAVSSSPGSTPTIRSKVAASASASSPPSQPPGAPTPDGSALALGAGVPPDAFSQAGWSPLP